MNDQVNGRTYKRGPAPPPRCKCCRFGRRQRRQSGEGQVYYLDFCAECERAAYHVKRGEPIPAINGRPR